MRKSPIIYLITGVLVCAPQVFALTGDKDGDGVADANDNCWYVINPDQSDSDFSCPSMPFNEDPECGNACDNYCQYTLIGDVNYDCIINLSDYALISLNWLVDCNSAPDDPACFFLDIDKDGWNSSVDCDDWNPNSWPGAPEICDGWDNDCDGLVDEDFTELGEVCIVGVGTCEAIGTMVCSGNGSGTECSAIPGSPDTEVCDGLDNDCDGLVDNDPLWENQNEICSEGQGICQAYGVYICDVIDPYGPTICSASAGDPDVEVCNSLDDDCDGLVDEDWPMLNEVCSVGVGECTGYGIWVCTGDYSGTECTAVPGEPVAEDCYNYLDDDCDGLIDFQDPSCP